MGLGPALPCGDIQAPAIGDIDGVVPAQGFGLVLGHGQLGKHAGLVAHGAGDLTHVGTSVRTDAEQPGEVGVGQTDSATSSGYLNFEGPLTSVETRLGIALSNLGREGDQLTVSGGVPLHVVDGTATTRLPTGRDAAGNIKYTASETSIKSDIPLEMRLDYAVPLTDKLTVGVNSAVRREGNTDVYGDVALGLRLKF